MGIWESECLRTCSRLHSQSAWEVGLEPKSTAKPRIFPYAHVHEVCPRPRDCSHIIWTTYSHVIKVSHEPMRWVTFWFYFLNKKTDTCKVTRSVISSDDICTYSGFRVHILLSLYYFLKSAKAHCHYTVISVKQVSDGKF